MDVDDPVGLAPDEVRRTGWTGSPPARSDPPGTPSAPRISAASNGLLAAAASGADRHGGHAARVAPAPGRRRRDCWRAPARSPRGAGRRPPGRSSSASRLVPPPETSTAIRALLSIRITRSSPGDDLTHDVAVAAVRRAGAHRAWSAVVPGRRSPPCPPPC